MELCTKILVRSITHDASDDPATVAPLARRERNVTLMGTTPWPADGPLPGEPWDGDALGRDVTDAEDPLPEEEMLNLLLPPDTPFADQLALEHLVDTGFTWTQAVLLLDVRQRMTTVAATPQGVARSVSRPSDDHRSVE